VRVVVNVATDGATQNRAGENVTERGFAFRTESHCDSPKRAVGREGRLTAQVNYLRLYIGRPGRFRVSLFWLIGSTRSLTMLSPHNSSSAQTPSGD
jgi:hypothetical protein